jgi:hypothetical protein
MAPRVRAGFGWGEEPPTLTLPLKGGGDHIVIQ